MEKRFQIGIVFAVGLVVFAYGIYILYGAFFPQQPAQQPPALPSQVIPDGTPNPTAPPPETQPKTPQQPVIPAAPPSPDAAAFRTLENRARAVVESVGTGSSATGFSGYTDVAPFVTAAELGRLRAEQSALQETHPQKGPPFGMTTRATSAKSAEAAKAGDANVTLTVEALQSEDAGDAAHITKRSGKKILVSMKKQADGQYLIDAMTWTDFEL